MKILVIRFSSIGDIVLTTPIIRCLATQIPNAEVHFITKAKFASVVEHNPYISKTITIERSVKEVLQKLKAENYDYVIDLHNNIRTLKLKFQLRKKCFSFPKKNIQKLLLTAFKWDKMPPIHVVDRYFEAVKSLGVINDQLKPDFFLTEKDSVDLNSVTSTTSTGSDTSAPESDLPPFLAVAVGAQFATKQIPFSLFIEVLSKIKIPIVLLGGEMDLERAIAIQNGLKLVASVSEVTEPVEVVEANVIVNFCGKLTLRQSAYVLSKASQLLTGDTGLMHIASAFEIPTVSVWGNTVPAFGMYPYSPQNPSNFSIHEVANLSCRPCSKIGFQSCPKKHFNCMNLQNGEAITNDLLSKPL